MYENLKKVCSLISEANALRFQESMGQSVSEPEPEVMRVLGAASQIETLAEIRSIWGFQGTTRSGVQDKEGTYIEFSAFTQVFQIDAPELLGVVNEIAKLFSLTVSEKEGERASLRITGEYDPNAPDFFAKAHYFVGAEEISAVDLHSGKVLTLRGRHTGGVYMEAEGGVIGFDIEEKATFDTIVHELVHRKWPEQLPHQEALVARVATEIHQKLSAEGLEIILYDEKIDDERNEAIKAFQWFDSALAGLLG